MQKDKEKDIEGLLLMQALQGLGNIVPGQFVKAAEPEVVEDDGLGERDVYKDLKLPSHIDSMMHEHAKFLQEFGTTHSHNFLLGWTPEKTSSFSWTLVVQTLLPWTPFFQHPKTCSFKSLKKLPQTQMQASQKVDCNVNAAISTPCELVE